MAKIMIKDLYYGDKYAVMQDYLCNFDTIEFAVYHTEREVANYEAFCKEIRS